MKTNLTYNQLRNAAEDSLAKKNCKGRIRVLLGYSTCSVTVGANEVLKALQEAVAYGQLRNVIIETTGCVGLCSKEPLIDVIMPDDKKFTYELVTPKKAMAIVINHSLYEEDVEEWLIKM
ncbi:(2Fe-2S) ferredoxin domain-containing protein [Alkaliphilus serpentinus]|uniref:(2Fe-2S) ferredoxin domain-containing protein n=1 Tax=Alkaliphilus serpentinus TaxID=1482731 RepID=A0A833HQ92_9FIRM|nr:(2Fe-2S) ferredoxin domain-containing protein [Alkaliphilus serpentinus]KAB3530701.1 (2Fe-2S) ferredoxin domain-containing protein [Alkaliphilus serpentinus]